MGDTIPERGRDGPRGKRPVFVLALDASLSRCSVALEGEGRLLAHRAREGDRGHAAALPPMAAAVLAEAAHAEILRHAGAGAGRALAVVLRARRALAFAFLRHRALLSRRSREG